jgi:hypothetical protein
VAVFVYYIFWDCEGVNEDGEVGIHLVYRV